MRENSKISSWIEFNCESISEFENVDISENLKKVEIFYVFGILNNYKII